MENVIIGDCPLTGPVDINVEIKFSFHIPTKKTAEYATALIGEYQKYVTER